MHKPILALIVQCKYCQMDFLCGPLRCYLPFVLILSIIPFRFSIVPSIGIQSVCNYVICLVCSFFTTIQKKYDFYYLQNISKNELR